MRIRLVSMVALLALAAAACGELEQLSTAEALDRLNVATTKVYDIDGNVIANLHGEIDRDIVTFEEIPAHVQHAVLAIEDERFWQHQGLDIRSIARAALSNVGEGTGRVQGGSTISQQLAKNLYFPSPDRTINRKLAEARVTWQLENQYSKTELLEMYLNTIYFGRGVYGIETAAWSYFRRHATDLSVADAAFLAGVIHEPARYGFEPDDAEEERERRRRLGTARRNVVIDRMVEAGWLTRAEADEAKAEPLHLASSGERRWQHPYFVDLVLRQLGVLRSRSSDQLDPRFAFLGDSFEERGSNVYRGGLRIYTTLDPNAQRAAEEAIADVLPADLDRLSTALVSIEPKNGYIRALVGGRDYYPDCPEGEDLPQWCELSKVNLALGEYGGGSGRQPGSSFKPFVLAAALSRGMTLRQTYSSEAFTYAYPGGTWNVSNYAGSGEGDMDLVSGTMGSVNAVFARLLVDGVGDGDALTGAQQVATVARAMGVDLARPEELQAACGDDYLRTDPCQPADATPAIALGAKEVAPIDLASAYATFANDGVRVTPVAIVRVTDGDGAILFDATHEERQALPSGVARAVTYALQQVVTGGTAAGAAIGRPAAAKTGTSQAWRDAWLAGFTPQLATVVWVGNPVPVPGSGVESMTPSNGYPTRIVGGSYPASIWRAYMSEALAEVPARDFAPAPTVFFGTPIERDDDELDDAPDGVGRTVPSVVGQLFSSATSELQQAGFSVSRSEACAPSDVRLHRVWSQDPAPGEPSPDGRVRIVYQPGGC